MMNTQTGSKKPLQNGFLIDFMSGFCVFLFFYNEKLTTHTHTDEFFFRQSLHF